MSLIQDVSLTNANIQGIYPTANAYWDHHFEELVAECPHCEAEEGCICFINNERTSLSFDSLESLRDLILKECPCVLHTCSLCGNKFLISFEAL